MKRVLLQLLLPPFVMIFPWMSPALQKQKNLTVCLFFLWSLGLGIMLFKWAGVGFIVLLALGIFAIFTARIPVKV